VGFLNGVLITKTGLPPFIITLGMANIARGFTLVITKGYSLVIQNDFIVTLGQGNIGIVPIMVLSLPVIILVSWWLYKKTVFGNYVKAIGGNETAARLSGVKVIKNKVIVYTFCGLLCGIAALIVTGRLNSGSPNSGLNFDMNSIAAVMVGGTALSGGSGTIIGTMLGAILLGVIQNGLVLLNVNMYWQTVATGAIIILVCTLDAFSHRKGQVHG
jgi:ribose/xylose/arabinose/galactoside ABC-type transport system permease subunit